MSRINAPVKPEPVTVPDRPTFSPKVRAEIHLAAGGRCEKCGVKVGKGEYEIDHKEDRFYRGDDSRANLWVLCIPCHKDKTGSTAGRRAKTRRQAEKFGPDSERSVSANPIRSRPFPEPRRVPARRSRP